MSIRDEIITAFGLTEVIVEVLKPPIAVVKVKKMIRI